MKKAMLLFVSLLLSAGVNAASVVTFDFAAYADAPFSAGPNDPRGEQGGSALSFTESGVNVVASGTAGKAAAFAYLDAGNAGLGLCKNLDGSAQCDPGNDDNVQMGELLKLTFDQNITLGIVDFVNGNHFNTFTGTVEIGSYFNGVWSFMSAALADIDETDLGLKGSMFTFLNTSTGTNNKEQFYINTLQAQVPVPAALFLFAPALLGFLGLRRRKAA